MANIPIYPSLSHTIDAFHYMSKLLVIRPMVSKEMKRKMGDACDYGWNCQGKPVRGIRANIAWENDGFCSGRICASYAGLIKTERAMVRYTHLEKDDPVVTAGAANTVPYLPANLFVFPTSSDYNVSSPVTVLPYGSLEAFTWDYHVASIVRVLLSDASHLDLVLDPLIHPQGPLPVSMWFERLFHVGRVALCSSTCISPSYPCLNKMGGASNFFRDTTHTYFGGRVRRPSMFFGYTMPPRHPFALSLRPRVPSADASKRHDDHVKAYLDSVQQIQNNQLLWQREHMDRINIHAALHQYGYFLTKKKNVESETFHIKIPKKQINDLMDLIKKLWIKYRRTSAMVTLTRDTDLKGWWWFNVRPLDPSEEET